MKEIWKAVEGFGGIYEVSNLGRVRSLTRIIKHSNGKLYTYNGIVLSKRLDNKGYSCVLLCHEGKYKCCKVHRLVANAFIPNPNNLPYVNHKDEVKDNNHVNNLEWCDAKHNSNYGTVQERRSKTLTNGVKSIPVIATLPDGTEEYYPSMADFSRVHNKPFSEGNISLAVSGKRKTAYGRKWRVAK